MLKVCIISDYLPRYHKIWSGAELISVSLADMLKDKRCRVFFITTPFDFKVSDFKYEIHPVHTPLKKLGTLSRNFPLDIVAIRGIYRILKRERPDIVHINSKYLYLSALIAALCLGIPRVVTVPDYFIFCPTTFIRRPNKENCLSYHGANCYKCISILSEGYLNRIIKNLPNIFLKLILYLRAREFNYFNSKVNTFIALSNFSRQRLIEYGINPGKIQILYHYKLSELKETREDTKNPAVLFVGWLSEENGVDILIDAFLEVIKTNKMTRLYLVGTGKEKFVAQLKAKIIKYAASDNILFLGKKENSETISIISSCDLVVVPHQWPKEFGPVILLEALAMGKPVIASKIGATEEYLKENDTGFLIEDYRNPSAFSAKIDYLLKNPQIATEMGKRGKVSVSFLFNDFVSEKIFELYKSLIN